MSKLKPIKDDAELARVPQEEPVLVELEPAATGEDLSARPEPEDDDPPPAADNGDDDIATQLRAAEQARDREREARERAEREADRLRASSADTEKELLTSSMEKAQQDQVAAKAEYKRAYEEGDADAMAEAQAKMARSAAQILNYEGAIANYGEGGRDKPARPDEPVDIMVAIDRDPKLLQSERDWLKQHPETLTDQRLNRKLTVAHDDALAAGHARGTDGYFRFVDKFMGYRKTDTGRSDNAERSPPVAPVSRDGRSLGGQPLKPSQVLLTPEEHAMAKTMGLSLKVYAEQKRALEQRKKSDPERYASR